MSRVDGPYRRAAIIALLLLAAVTYFSFARNSTFKTDYEVKAVFSTANQLRQGSDVRISGLPVGVVTSIDGAGGNASVVTMRIDKRDVPIRTDAKLAIEPRLALEGNYYVNVSPGSPSAPELDSGATIARTRTTGPVQVDQVLDVYDVPTRAALKGMLHALATGLGAEQGGKVDGAEGLRRAARELDGALGSVTQVTRALRGTRRGDLRRAIRSTGRFTGELAADPRALAAIVTNYRRVIGAFADNHQAVEATVRELDGLARTAPASLREIDAALPQLTDFASALRPALRAAPPALREGSGTLDQMTALFGADELPRLLTSLDPAVATLPTLNRRLTALFPLLTRATRCLNENIVPTLNMRVPDGKLSVDYNVWQEFLHMGANFAGLASGFDGNGSNVRLGVSSSPNHIIQAQLPDGKLTGIGNIAGVDPTFLGRNSRPVNRPDQWCDQQQLPNLGARRLEGLPPGFSTAPRPKASPADEALLTALLRRSKTGTLAALKKLTGGFSGAPKNDAPKEGGR